jgi:hypothetical protein
VKNASESTTAPALTGIELKWSIVNQDALSDDDNDNDKEAKVSKWLLLVLTNGWSNENGLKLSNVDECKPLFLYPSRAREGALPRYGSF